MADALGEGRSAFVAQAWADAYARLSAADRAAPLEADDLERPVTGGWVARARRVLAGAPPDSAERGYLRYLTAFQSLLAGEIGILHLEGALNERAGDDGAVGNRDARYVVGSRAWGRPATPTAAGSASGSATPGAGCGPSRPAPPTSTSRLATRATTGSGPATGPIRPPGRGQAALGPGNLFRANRNVPPAT